MKTLDQKKIAGLKQEVKHLKLLLQEAAALLRKIMEFADKYEELDIPATPVQKRKARVQKRKTRQTHAKTP